MVGTSVASRSRLLLRLSHEKSRAKLQNVSGDSSAIYKSAYALLRGTGEGRASRGARAAGEWAPDAAADRTFMGISPEEDLDTELVAYAEQVVEARQILG